MAFTSRNNSIYTRNNRITAWVALLVIAVIEGSQSASVSAMTCKLHDTNNGPCLQQQWQNIFFNGNNDIPDLPTLEPYKPRNVRISIDIPILTLNMSLKKIIVTGLSHAKVSDVSVTNAEKVKLTLTIPKLNIKGNYALEGRILLLNLNGKGPMDTEMTDVVMNIEMNLKTVDRNGEHFLEPSSLTTDVKKIGNMHVMFGNLFADNQMLTDSANEVFNQNWREIIELARPVIQETMDSSFLEQTKKFLNQVPARRLFSDIA